MFQNIPTIDHILAWKSKKLSDEYIKPAACHNSLAPTLNYINIKIRVNFNGSYLQLEELTFTHKEVVKICIVW